MRRSPNIVYVGDTVDDFTVLQVRDDHIITLSPQGFEHVENYPEAPWPEERYITVRTASPVQGHRSGRGDAAREGDGTGS